MEQPIKAPSAAYDKDLYRVLEVHPGASDEVIDAAHRALLKKYAPRALGDSDARAKDIGEAYAILSKPKDHRLYNDYRSQSQELIGPYRLLHKVARGGFGTTYKAEHTQLGQYSCIKHCTELDAGMQRIFIEETKAIWDLRHVGLPCMRDFLRLDDGTYAIAMSWIEGLTIEEEVKKTGPIAPEDLAWRIERVLNTLWYLHDHGVLHGDIKPSNTMVESESHISVLVDFGLSAVKPTASTAIKGFTRIFSPPEQVEGKRLKPASDFFSLGMTMIYALTGDYERAAHKDVPIGLPDPLCRFIRSLIVRDMYSRPQSARELVSEFERVRIESFGRAHTRS